MPNKQPDNPYASPQSIEHITNAVKRRAVNPYWIVSIAVAFGFPTGAVSGYVRPMITGPVHYEAIISMLLIALFLLVALTICLKTQRPVKWISVVFSLTWLTYFAGWSLGAILISSRMSAPSMSGDMLGVCVGGAVLSLAIALTLEFLLRRFQNRKTSSQTP